jgi:nucleoside-diphosphate kinase
MRPVDAERSDQHYAVHVERDFYPPLRDFVTSGVVIDVLDQLRQLSPFIGCCE